MNLPFEGKKGANLVVTPNGTSAAQSIGKGNKSVRVCNSGSNICYVRFGVGSATATTADSPVLSGESVIFRKSEGEDYIAYISASGTTLNIQPGEGGS